MASVLHLGMMRAAPFPCLGQIAPKMRVSRGGSLVRRRALTRAALGPAAGDLVLWPMRASSANQTSMAAGFLDALLAPRSRPGAREKLF